MDSNHRLTDFKSVDSSAGLYPHKKNTHNLLETVAPVKGKNLVAHESIDLSSSDWKSDDLASSRMGRIIVQVEFEPTTSPL